MLKQLFFTSAMLLMPFLVLSQINDQYGWKVTSKDTLSKKETQAIRFLKKGGYKVDIDSLRTGRVVLRTDGVEFLAPLLKSKKFELVVLSKSGDELVLNGKELKNQMIAQFDGSTFSESKSQEKVFKEALKGKKKFTHKKNRVKWHIDFGDLESKYFTGKFEFRYKNKPFGQLVFSKINGEMALNLPQLENEVCVPFERYTHFKKLSELSASLVKAKRYTFKDGKNFTKRFQLSFAKNSSAFDPYEVNEIKGYLSKENISIKKAKIMAYASIEGDSAKNAILQQKRAAVLWKTLDEFKDQNFSKSVSTSERWSYFYNQLKLDSITKFDSLSKQEIKHLFEDKNTQNKYEHLLKGQRKAYLSLQLYKKYTLDDKLAILRKDIQKLDKKVTKALYLGESEGKHAQLKKLAIKLVSIELALEKLMRDGVVNKDDIDRNFDFIVYYSHEWYMIRFYTMQRQMRRGNYPQFNSIERIIIDAYQSSLGEIKSTAFYDGNIPLRQATDVQSYAYELIKKGEIDASFFHELQYSDNAKYFHLALNKLNFKRLNENLIPPQPEEDNTAKIGELSVYNSRYYFMLKDRITKQTGKVAQMVERTDKLYMWDLYEFVWFNIEGWNVWDNKFFDPEIDEKSMNYYISKLFAIGAVKICGDDLYQLAINFHLKVLQSSAESKAQSYQFKKSYKYLTRYYLDRSKKLDGKTAYDISAQLVFLNNLFYRNEPIKAADKIMQAAWQENLMDKRKEYFYSDVHGSLR